MDAYEYRNVEKAVDDLHELNYYYQNQIKECESENDLIELINSFYKEALMIIINRKLNYKFFHLLSTRITEEIIVLEELYRINKQAWTARLEVQPLHLLLKL